MEQVTNKARVEQELAAKHDQIKRRIDDLEGEIVTTPAAIASWIKENPFIGVGAAVAAGALIGLIFGGRKKKRSMLPPAHQALVEGYIDAVTAEVRKGLKRGEDPEDIVRDSLQGKTPVIIYAPHEEKREPKGFFRQLGDLTMKTALGFAVKTALDFFSATIDMQELQKMMALEEEERQSRSSEASGEQSGATQMDEEAL